MAIAALPDEDLFESPWPRPALRLVDGGRCVGFSDSVLPNWDDVACISEEWAEEPLDDCPAFEPPELRSGPDVSARRQRAKVQVRRRRLVVGALLVGLLFVLAAPISALGGRSVAGAPPAGPPAARVHNVVYVVKQGDTLGSIAARINPDGDAESLVAALSSELGSASLTPGERIILP